MSDMGDQKQFEGVGTSHVSVPIVRRSGQGTLDLDPSFVLPDTPAPSIKNRDVKKEEKRLRKKMRREKRNTLGSRLITKWAKNLWHHPIRTISSLLVTTSALTIAAGFGYSYLLDYLAPKEDITNNVELSYTKDNGEEVQRTFTTRFSREHDTLSVDSTHAVFGDAERPEQAVENAIEYISDQRDIVSFNISVSDGSFGRSVSNDYNSTAWLMRRNALSGLDDDAIVQEYTQNIRDSFVKLTGHEPDNFIASALKNMGEAATEFLGVNDELANISWFMERAFPWGQSLPTVILPEATCQVQSNGGEIVASHISYSLKTPSVVGQFVPIVHETARDVFTSCAASVESLNVSGVDVRAVYVNVGRDANDPIDLFKSGAYYTVENVFDANRNNPSGGTAKISFQDVSQIVGQLNQNADFFDNYYESHNSEQLKTIHEWRRTWSHFKEVTAIKIEDTQYEIEDRVSLVKRAFTF